MAQGVCAIPLPAWQQGPVTRRHRPTALTGTLESLCSVPPSSFSPLVTAAQLVSENNLAQFVWHPGTRKRNRVKEMRDQLSCVGIGCENSGYGH